MYERDKEKEYYHDKRTRIELRQEKGLQLYKKINVLNVIRNINKQMPNCTYMYERDKEKEYNHDKRTRIEL